MDGQEDRGKLPQHLATHKMAPHKSPPGPAVVGSLSAAQASGGSGAAAPKRKGPKPTYDEGSRRLAALGYGLLVILGAPVLSLDYVTDDGITRFFQFSPPHVAALAVLDHAPNLKVLAQTIMLPAAYMQAISMTVKYCLDKNTERCTMKPLLDPVLMLNEADVSYLLPRFHKSFQPQYLKLLYAGGLIVTIAGVAGLYKPVRLGVVGFILLVVAAYFTPDAGLMPTLIMEAFLGIYVLFFDPEAMEKEDKRQAAKKAAELAKKNSKKKGGAAASGTPQSGAKSTAAASTPSSSASQRKGRAVDKKNLYDI